MIKLLVRSLEFVVILIFLLITINYQLSTIHAADATGSASLTTSPSADIKAKLEELKREIASKAAKLKDEVDRKLQNKAYVGKVKTKSANSLTLAARSGPKIVSLNQDTVYESNIKGKKFSNKILTEEDYVAALGDVDETGVLTAKKIILLPTPNSQPKTYLWGQIIAISDKLVTLKDKDLKNVAATTPTGSDIGLNDFVILTGNEPNSFSTKDNIFRADFVYVFPQGGILKPKKSATPSAESSSSAKKK